ncbi:YjbF family lipoprotein [Antarcticimicrobium sediminis]|uniref:YjbF family lipoprotein n=1 Tax=Antarcticimicrobium sediminis TaxID=2546227 RepID=A0A4R5EIN4_9RHOB|nr:YjbF family lipoprotein [Antarcticimicrobium sediminis]TDE34230.1 YjbF family lipoprotein [Antarcticimicrobium sediminis]
MSRNRLLRRLAGLGAAALLALAGCSRGTDAPPTQLQLLNAARGSVGQIARKARGTAAPTRPPLTRAALDTVTVPVLEVTVERRDDWAFLFRTLERSDSSPGRIEQWNTEDSNVTLSLRNGVLIATRGLGGDLLSSAVQVVDGQPGPASGGEHLQMIRNLDYRETALTLSCELVDLGPETIEIVERRHATHHLQQRCEGGGGRVVNDYWTDPRAGIIWKSRQWAGPHLGYLSLRRLVK